MNIQSKLTYAITLCETKKVRLTDTRKEVLALLYQETQPVSAYDLLGKLREIKTNAEPPTVYRALEFLCEQQLAHRIEASNSYVACNHPHETHSEQMLTCQRCGCVVEIENDELSKVIQRCAKKNGFHTENCRIEIRGLCLKC